MVVIMVTHYIYKITNKLNGNFYIGYTNNPKRRWKDHKQCAKSGEASRFYNAVRKYGNDQFTFEVIEELPSAEAAKNREIELIAELDPEYNSTAGGDGMLNPSPELRRKMSEAIRNSPKNEGRLARAWETRRSLVTEEEWSIIMSGAQSNMTPEQKEEKARKWAESWGNRTDEAEAERQRKRAETVASWTPEQHEEYRQKLSESNKNRILSEETQAKIDAGAKQGGHITGQLMKQRLAAMSPEEYEARNKNLGDKIREGRANESDEKKAERERKRLASYLATRARNKAAKEAANK